MPTPTQQLNRDRGMLTLLRDLVPNRALSQFEALQIAELQAVRLRSYLGIDTVRFPRRAINGLPRVQIRYDTDLPTSGMSFWDGSNWIILVDPTEAVNRQRFSLTHEFKHIIDHSTKNFLYGPATSNRSAAAEQAADYFAACLLMPKMLVKRHWGRGPRSVTEMAKLFQVSPAAMKYRLKQLGLVETPRRCGRPESAYTRRRPGRFECVR